jgi:hypothetical protein
LHIGYSVISCNLCNDYNLGSCLRLYLCGSDGCLRDNYGCLRYLNLGGLLCFNDS